MNDFDVMSFKDFKKQKALLCCETVSGARFVIKQIAVRGVEVRAVFSDGTRAEPEMLSGIYQFFDVKSAQDFLLNNEK